MNDDIPIFSNNTDQTNIPGFIFTFPNNNGPENPLLIQSSEEKFTQANDLENANNNSLQKAFLTYINSKNQATDLLLWAAKSNQPNMIHYLIGNNVNINESINSQNSLYQAVSNGNLDLADDLIQNGAHFNGNDKENLLYNAIKTEKLEIVQYLVKKGANIDYKIKNLSFLDVAVRIKNFNIIKYLIENNAELYNVPKYTLISYIIENNSLELVKRYIEKGMNVNFMDNYKRTLLHKAVLFNKFDIVKYLVNNEAININAQDINQYTPLLLAVEKSLINIAELLIKKSIEKDNTGNTLNIMGNEIINNTNTNNGFGINCRNFFSFQNNINNQISKTPLYEASKNGSFDIVKLLVENKASLNKKASNGISPINIAFQNDYIDIVKYLIEQGADINSIDNDGRSLINKVVEKNSNGSAALVEYLIEKGAKINKQSKDGWTPLHEAVQVGNKEVVQILINHDAFVNAKDKSLQWTPLHEASLNGDLVIFKLLVENNADIDATDVNGLTPRFIVEKSNFTNILAYLKNKSAPFTSTLLNAHNKTIQKRKTILAIKNSQATNSSQRQHRRAEKICL
ncbi:ankyrin repeat-containing domain protein [Neocallimastix lanati (nom. inval.)]|nr:ankyrin repeat-containing domain protein [Neocallimastix sp. JGI-2020a]